LELCSIIVVTTLSPSRNSVSSEYMTALMASVVLRYSAMLARPGAPMNCAIVSYDSSNSLVICCEAEDCPRWTFSYPMVSAGLTLGGRLRHCDLKPARATCTAATRCGSRYGQESIALSRTAHARWHARGLRFLCRSASSGGHQIG
jgi:hypothetical protein